MRKEPGSRSGRPFEDELRAYLDWVRPHLAAAGLTWQGVVVAERDESTLAGDAVAGDAAKGPALRGAENSPTDFAARFSEILDDVARDWVNLTVDTIERGRLIVVVEWCSRPYPGHEGRHGRPVSVNWSGMTTGEIARLTRGQGS